MTCEMSPQNPDEVDTIAAAEKFLDAMFDGLRRLSYILGPVAFALCVYMIYHSL